MLSESFYAFATVMIPLYLWCAMCINGILCTFVSGATWNKDELITFWGQKFKV